jgi:sigma-E factor negative regulatory protein RseC
MQNSQGQVVSVSSDDSGAKAIVEVESVVICERCESGRGCGAGLMGRQVGDKRVEAVVANGLDIKSGDLVSIALESRHILRAALIVYGSPLLGAVVAAIVAFSMGFGEAEAVLAALLGLLAGILVAKLRLQNTQCLRDFTPMIIEKHHQGQA